MKPGLVLPPTPSVPSSLTPVRTKSLSRMTDPAGCATDVAAASVTTKAIPRPRRE